MLSIFLSMCVGQGLHFGSYDHSTLTSLWGYGMANDVYCQARWARCCCCCNFWGIGLWWNRGNWSRICPCERPPCTSTSYLLGTIGDLFFNLSLVAFFFSYSAICFIRYLRSLFAHTQTHTHYIYTCILFVLVSYQESWCYA